VENRVGFFLHIPFPPLDIYLKLPWRSEIIEGLLEYDLIGFQTPRDRNNFLQCVRAMFKGFRVDTRRRVSAIMIDGRQTVIGNFPISIDFMEFARQAASKVVTEKASQLRQSLGNRHIILGVDRLDYSKGVPEKLRAFRYTLERFRDLREKITMVQILVPSREDILGYQILRTEIEDLTNQINGKFARPGWTPIQHIFRTLDRSELLAYYRAADIALITSLKDGMNLVAKEYCAAKVDRSGVLILSEFAGAASQLHRNSLLVNPYDIEGIANAIRRGYDMSASERQLRMQRLRKSVARRNIFWWADSFLRAAADKGD
jgi:trehalose 6-phosphate synthase